MSGSQPAPPGAGGGQPGADPSMEDILASIRRILSEDVPQPAPDSPPGMEEPPSDVLVLDQSMMVPEPQPDAAPPRAEPEPVATSRIPAQMQELRAQERPQERPQERIEERSEERPEERAAERGDGGEPLVAPEAAAAAAFSVNNLVRRLSAERGTLVRSGGPTIEDMVREELRPMLKQWLDANLPPLVERLVKAEIERVVGRIAP